MKTKLSISLFAILLFISYAGDAAMVYVTNVNDSGAGSFRNALASAGNGDQIQFNIPGTGYHLITLTSTGLTVTQSNLTIDATTQSGYSCGNPTVIIDFVGVWPASFTVQGSNNIIKGLSFRSVYFTFDTGGNNQLLGCWFNLNDDGTAASGKHMDQNLLRFVNSSGNTIGGTACDTRNVFSIGGTVGTWQGTVKLNSGSNNNKFTGNYFGTDKSGMTLLNTNSDHIFYVSGCTNITIDQNVISGANINGASGGAGIYCDGTDVSGLTITNNKIGVKADGTDGGTSWGNAYGGVANLATTCNNFTFTGNISCRNGLVLGPDIKKCGLYISSSGTTLTIKNNYIGVTPTTYTLAGNYFTGIFINGVNSSITIDNNVIGDNGGTLTDGDESHGLSLEQPCTNVTITNNYIGMTPQGRDIGNYCSGITVSGGSNYTITGNYIGFNKGSRTGIPNGGLVFTNTTDVVIQGNIIGGWTAANMPGGQKNMAAELNGGMGIFISGSTSKRFRIGGMTSGQQNLIAYNRTNGIAVQSADFVEMRWNKLYCNGLKGIELFYGTGSVGNNNFGNGTIKIYTPASTLPTSINGLRPTNSIVDVFGTNACASSSNCITQGEYRYATGTYTPSASGDAGTTWSYNHGSAMYDDLSALATGGSSDCNTGYCRTSEFSPCVDNTLPVTFMMFTASVVNEIVELKWGTSEERNSSVFVIERSIDGNWFEPIGEVKAAGSSSQNIVYHFTDRSPLSGLAYYRIHEVDIDQKSTYSNLEVVDLNPKVNLVVIPNPNSGNFKIEIGSLSSESLLQIHNLLGELIYSQTLEANASYESFPIHLAEGVKGIFIVSLTSQDGTLTSKIIVE